MIIDHKIQILDDHITDMETDQCLKNNGGCWRDDKTNVTACKVPIISKFLVNSARSIHIFRTKLLLDVVVHMWGGVN